MVWAVKQFRHYLYGHHCDVFTDHEALKSLNTPHPFGRLARWGLALQEVDLSIFYCPSKRNQFADALSRAPVSGGDPQHNAVSLVAAVLDPQSACKSREGSLRARQRQDPGLKQVIAYLETGELPP